MSTIEHEAVLNDMQYYLLRTLYGMFQCGTHKDVGGWQDKSGLVPLAESSNARAAKRNTVFICHWSRTRFG